MNLRDALSVSGLTPPHPSPLQPLKQWQSSALAALALAPLVMMGLPWPPFAHPTVPVVEKCSTDSCSPVGGIHVTLISPVRLICPCRMTRAPCPTTTS